MHLIAALAAGVKGAESGSATLYKRGTSSLADYYTDYEASTQITGGSVTLDSNGGAVVYVNEVVDVTVKDSSGNTVRQWSDGAAAPNLEYIGQSFTGVDYDSGESAVSKPVTLQDILDLWKDNAGAIDWKVSLAGTATTLQTALASGRLFVFNVKDSTYGAKGDGTTDDYTAIAAAVTAACTASNTYGCAILFFPYGKYLIKTGLTITKNLLIWGGGSTLQIDNATGNILNIQAGATVCDLTLKAVNTSCSGVLVSSTGNLTIQNCTFDGTNSTGTLVLCSNTSTAVRIDKCAFSAYGASKAISCVYTNSAAEITDCKFTPNGTYATTMIDINKGSIKGCWFVGAAADASSYTYITLNTPASGNLTVSDCRFHTCAGGGTATAFTLGTITDATRFSEYNNTFERDDYLVWYSYTLTADDNTDGVRLNSRENRVLWVSDNDAAYEFPADQYGIIRLTSTAAAIVPKAKLAPTGSSLRIQICNASGGAMSVMPVAYFYGYINSGWTIADTATDGTRFTAQYLSDVAINIWFEDDYYTT